MTTEQLKWMERLSNAFGPSGFEDEVVAIGREYAEPFAEVTEDSIRNLYIKRKKNTGDRPVVMLDAHSDEVGFIIQFIKPNGTLQFLQLGSWNEFSIPGTKVWIKNDLGELIPGIVAAKPVHFMSADERNRVIHTDDMVIDIGACSAEEVETVFHISVGAPVCPAVLFEAFPDKDLMTGKAFDCRVGCMALLMAMEELADADLAVDVVGVFSTQEEVGGRGAKPACRTVNPVVTVGFEGCPADDTFTPEYAIQSAMKRGPMIRLMDISMVTHPRFARFSLDVCKQNNIPVQIAVRKGGGTNAGVYHSMQMGIPSITVSVPSRYAHTPQGFASMTDVEQAAKAAAAIVKALNEDILKGL